MGKRGVPAASKTARSPLGRNVSAWFDREWRLCLPRFSEQRLRRVYAVPTRAHPPRKGERAGFFGKSVAHVERAGPQRKLNPARAALGGVFMNSRNLSG